MKKLLYIVLVSLLTAVSAQAAKPSTIPVGEKLSYNIYFHMGFIWAKAGYGELSFTQAKHGGTTQLHGQLAAKSLSIVEHIMQVRDTLDCWFNTDMVPTEFRKATHEGSYNAIARNVYSTQWHDKNAANTPANVDSTYVTINRWRKKGKDDAKNEKKAFTNKGVAYDMLSVFYTIRNLDYAKLTKGKKMKFVCYDGVKCQTINFEYYGTQRCELRDGKKYDSYLIHLTFDTKGQEATPLKVWLSKTSGHHPIKAVIALNRIGSVQCEVTQ